MAPPSVLYLCRNLGYSLQISLNLKGMLGEYRIPSVSTDSDGRRLRLLFGLTIPNPLVAHRILDGPRGEG